MKPLKTPLVKALFLFILLPLCGETRFSDPDLREDDTLMFMAAHSDSYGKGNYGALIRSNLEDRSLSLLTHYPEEHFYSSRSGELFLWNRFGFYVFSGEKTALPRRMDIYPSLETGATVQLGKLLPMSISPDGRFFIYYRAVDWTKGDLLLFDREKGYSSLITSSVTMDYEGSSIRWSENSRFFAYVKQGSLYYFSIDRFLEDKLPEEETRRLGEGGAGSFKWGGDGRLYFIVGNEVLSVQANEMFALSFYDSPLQIGTVAGQLFFDFNGNFDDFWISPDRTKILVKREGGALFLVNLEFRNYNDYGKISRFPFLKLPVGSEVRKILWSDSGQLFLLAGSELAENTGGVLYKYDPEKAIDSFVETKQKNVVDMALSPDQQNIVLLYPHELTVRDSRRWTLLRTADFGPNMACYWADESRILLLGEGETSLYDIVTEKNQILFFSQCDDYGFSLDGHPQLTSKGRNYLLEEETDTWQETDDLFYREREVSNDSYRVFLTDNNRPVIYGNLLMVRKSRDFGTEPLLADMEQTLIPLDSGDSGNDPSLIFNNGSRSRRREVSLVFNVTNNITGMMDILNVLAEYNIKTTFFVNGDSIRKYPQAIKALGDSGHELGSLFYTVINMTDRKYNIDKDFIIRGLARNEDEFFRATGRELLPLWHAPWYFVNSEIVAASEEMNYTYVGRDVETLDWVNRDDEFLYYGADEIIGKIREQIQPGSIIPLSVGSEADRGDYVFQKLELLLNGLIKEGYEVVPVGLLMEHSK